MPHDKAVAKHCTRRSVCGTHVALANGQWRLILADLKSLGKLHIKGNIRAGIFKKAESEVVGKNRRWLEAGIKLSNTGLILRNRYRNMLVIRHPTWLGNTPNRMLPYQAWSYRFHKD